MLPTPHDRLKLDALSVAEQGGLQECKARDEAKATHRLLNRRCGPLSETTTARIKTQSPHQIWCMQSRQLRAASGGIVATVLACADHAQVLTMARQGVKRASERATERVAVLMTPTEKAAYSDRANSLGLSLGQFFREAGAAYVSRSVPGDEEEALEAALSQLEWSTSHAEQTLDEALAEVRSALNGGS